MHTLIEYMKMSQDPLEAGFVESLYLEETFMQYMPFKGIRGLALGFARELEMPSPAFRNLNEPHTEGTGQKERLQEALRFFGGDSDTDRELIKAYGDEERSANDAAWAKAMSIKFMQYFFYGNSGARTSNTYDDVSGFDGLTKRITAGQSIDGGGATGTDGSSVFGIRFGSKMLHGIELDPGLEVRDLGELRSGAPVMRTRIDWTASYAVKNTRAIGWIYDLTVAAGLTNALMDSLVDSIPGGPDVIVMTKRSRSQLKNQCYGLGFVMATTLDELGRSIPAWGEVPIITTEALIDNEIVP